VGRRTGQKLPNSYRSLTVETLTNTKSSLRYVVRTLCLGEADEYTRNYA
jgi:hypothetical protein